MIEIYVNLCGITHDRDVFQSSTRRNLYWNIMKLSIKLSMFTANKRILAKIMKFVFRWVENIVGKGENAGYQHFCLFP